MKSERKPCIVGKCRDASDELSYFKIIVIALMCSTSFFFGAWIFALIPAWYISDPNSYLLVVGIISIVILIMVIVVGIMENKKK